MTILQAAVLGVIQGLTEFIPVSSSGHLIVVPRLLGWSDHAQWFDVALHLGTLAAVVLYFWRDWVGILASFYRHIARREPYTGSGADSSGRLLVPIAVACVPAAVAGWKWEKIIESTLRQWYWVAGALVLIGVVMLVADRVGRKKRPMDEMSYVDYITIGCAQALALFPGVSRSGITISAGLFRNLDRAAAARFSFLLSTPIILGAAAHKLMGLHSEPGKIAAAPFAVGVATSAVVGYLAIGLLLNFLRKHTLNVFVGYRFALAAVVFVVCR